MGCFVLAIMYSSGLGVIIDCGHLGCNMIHRVHRQCVATCEVLHSVFPIKVTNPIV